jgi:glutamyl-tRNA reductase
MILHCLSVSHNKNNLTTLEKIPLYNTHQIYLTLQAENLEGIVVQTCLRTEVYWMENKEFTPRESLILCSKFFKVDETILNIEVFSGLEAIRHLFRVTAGLESAILGEFEILGQIRKALKEGQKQKTVKGFLSPILYKTINLGVKIRKKTDISKGNVSVGSIAVEMIKDRFRNNISSMVIVGAGEVAGLVGKSLSLLKIKKLYWMNRTYERSLMMTKRFDAIPLEFSRNNLRNALLTANVIVFAANCPRKLLFKEDFLGNDRSHTILLLDLGNPRNIDQEIEELPWVSVIDLNQINEWSKRNVSNRIKGIPVAEQMIEQALVDLQKYIHLQQFEPPIAEIYRSAEAIRKKQVEKAIHVFQQDPNNENCRMCKKKIDLITRSIVKQLLDSPIHNIRQISNSLPPEEVKKFLLLFKKGNFFENTKQTNIIQIEKGSLEEKDSCEECNEFSGSITGNKPAIYTLNEKL